MPQIRIANPADLHAIASLHTQNWRMAYRGILSDQYLDQELDADRLQDWQQRFDKPAEGQIVVVATDAANNLLGFACAYGKHDPQAGTLVENLHAHPEHRNLGLGRALLAYLAEWSLRHYPGDPVHLWVLEGNLPAIGFYQRMGGSQDQQAIWDAPGGTQVPELRFTWYQPADLLQRR